MYTLQPSPFIFWIDPNVDNVNIQLAVNPARHDSHAIHHYFTIFKLLLLLATDITDLIDLID